MPSISDIKVSIENKDILVKDEFIKQGEFVRNTNGTLQMYAGGFTAVFPVMIHNEKWAFRCWHTELGNVSRRFRAITNSIESSHAKYLCDFFYTDEGILVNGKIYPTTRMRWIDGITIKDYICKHAYDYSKLKKIAARFLEMIQDMHKQGFAHGDLQHGNILVDRKDNLFLVDYDSFYCPDLKGESDIITGLAAYQHPARKDCCIANEKLDYFSELIIYTSILAVAEKPELASKYNLSDAENMLFVPQDFSNLHHTEIYKDLSNINVSISQLLQIWDIYLDKTDINELEPFDTLLDQLNIVLVLSKEKIRLGREHSVLSWDAGKAKHIELHENGRILRTGGANQDKIEVSPKNTTQYELFVELKNDKFVYKKITLYVFPESEVSFTSDKNYVFPSIPFTLTWNVKNAVKVKLNGSEVEHSGKKVVAEGIEEETEYLLQVTDNFGIKNYPVSFKMLPVPVIHIHTTPPAISNIVNIVTNLKVPNIQVTMPSIPLKSIDLSVNPPEEIHYIEIKDDKRPFRKWFQFDSMVAKIKSIIKKKPLDYDK